MGGIVLVWLSLAAEKLWAVWPFLFVYTFAKLVTKLQAPPEEPPEARAERITAARWLMFLAGASLFMLLFMVTLVTGYPA